MSFPLKLNETHRRILALIRRHQPVARATLGKLAGVGSGPVTQVTRDLLLAGLIREGERIRGGRGQPALPLMLDPAGALSFGVALIPGKLRIVALDFCGEVVEESIAEAPDEGPHAIAEIVRRHIDKICAKVQLHDRSRVFGVGFALPGYFFKDNAQMRVVDAHASWRHERLNDLFSSIIGVPCWIENDATSAAMAEFYRHDDTADCLITLLINYGIGGGLIVGGQPFRGGHGNAGEIGAFFPLTQPRPSGTDLLQDLKAQGVDLPSLADIQYPDHQAHCQAWAERAGAQLRELVASAWSWFDPQLIVVSGSLPAGLLNDIVTQIQAPALFAEHADRPHPLVLPSSLGPSVAAIGAAYIPLHELTAQSPINIKLVI